MGMTCERERVEKIYDYIDSSPSPFSPPPPSIEMTTLVYVYRRASPVFG